MKKNYKKAILNIVFILLCCPALLKAQLVVDNTLTPEQLIQDVFIGTGIDVTNVTVTLQDGRQLSSFTNANSNLGISNGVMMSTGYCDEMSIPGMNNNGGFFSTDTNTIPCNGGGICGPGDADLDNLTSSNTFDAVVIEFDFIPLSDSVKFNYVFASEEYNEYGCSDFNDVFGFFLTGVTTAFPTTNIAIVPGSTPALPVAINTVNNGAPGIFGNAVNCSAPNGSLAYSSLFVNNGFAAPTGSGSFVEFDGMTVTLEASAEVIPCETYHIKLALADVFDGVWDSGVFLEGNSFSSGILDVDVSTASVDPLVVEDCTGDIAEVTLTLQEIQSTDYTIPLNIFGTAINGTDYITIPNSLVIPAGQSSVTFEIEPINDGIAEPVETVQIEVQTSVCDNDTITVYITENPPIPVPNLSCATTMSSITFSWDQAVGVLSYEVSLDGGATWMVPDPGPTSQLIDGLNPGDMATIIVRPIGACNVGNTSTLTCTAESCSPMVNISPSSSEFNCDIPSITLTANTSGINGTASYQWSTGVTDNGMTGTISSMGNYTVTITDDSNNCTTTATVFITEDFLDPSVTLASSQPEFNCSMPNNIILTASPTSQGAVTYEWSLPSLGTNATASIPSAGDYTVTITDTDNGCTASTTITLGDDFQDPTLSLIASDLEFNCGVSEMTLVATSTVQGVADYAWSSGTNLSPSQDSALILTAGTYSVTVTDLDNGCTATETITLGSDYLNPTVDLTSSQPEFTCSINDMTLTANTTTQGVISYAWSAGATGIGATVTITAPGDYSVTITDEDNGCTATNMITIGEDPTLPNIFMNASDPEFNCNVVGDITLNVLAIVQGTASYQWSAGITDNGGSGSVSAAGTYTVTITDSANTCTATSSIVIGEDYLDPSVSLASSQPEFNCSMPNNIILTASPTSQGAVTYEWSLPSLGTNATASIPSAGDYTVTITDTDNGCTASTTITLGDDFQDPTLSLIASDLEFNCGVSEMTLVATSTVQGVADYAWSSGTNLSPSQDSALILTAGTYSVTVTDLDNGCTATETITLGSDYLNPTVDLTSSQPEFTCSINDMTLTANTTTQGVISYAWSAGATGIGATVTITAPGDYSVTITDEDNGCTATNMITIGEDPTLPNIFMNASDPEFNCNVVGDITLNVLAIVQGTASYQWSAGITDNGGSGSVSAAGTYTVTITDSANTCTATSSIVIGEDYLEPSVSLSSDEAEFNCNISTITLTASPTVQGNATYQWSTGVTDNGSTGTIVAMGTYTVTVTDDDNGCTSTESITIGEDFLAPSVTLASDEPEFNCNISTITLTASPTVQGNATYQWSTGVTDNGVTGTIVAMGTYTVTITDDDNGCTSMNSITIGEDFLAPTVTLSSDEPEFNCNISTITLTASPTVQGNATYQWSTGVTDNGVTGTITTMGTYTVTITDDDNGCTSTNSITIGEDFLAPTVTLSSDEPEFNCNISTITLTASPTVQGNATYQWSTGVTDNGVTGTITTMGTYTVTITDDDNGCTSTNSITIGEDFLAPPLTLSSDEAEFNCNISTITLTASPTVQGNATYQWSTGVTDNGSTGTIVTMGTYTVTVTDDDNGCTSTESITIGEDFLAPSVTLASDEPEFNCNISTITLTASPTVQGNATYQWSLGVTDNGVTGTITTMGTYTVTITDDDNGCTSMNSITIGEDFLAPTVTLSSDEPEFNCNISTITLTASPTVQGNATYQWSTGVTDNGVTGTITTMGTYTVTITDDDNGCTSTNSITIGEDFLAPTVTLSSDEPEFNCNISTITLTASPTVQGNATYQWSTGVTDNGVTGTITTMGTYTVTITDDDNGCTSTNSITIGEDFLAPPLTLSSDEAEFNCNISTITLTASPTVQGNATYQWSTGVTDNGSTGTIVTMGTYTVTVTDDDNGCTSTESITIGEDFLAPSVTLASDEPEFNCNISTITLTASPTVQGNATYQWSLGVTDNGVTGTITTMGTYTVTITDDDNGCTSMNSITIGEDFLAPTVTLSSDEPEFNCNISTITLTASPTVQGNATYQWSTGVTDNGVTGTITTMGTYTVTITDDDNGCTSTNSITIGEDFLAPPIALSSDEPEFSCDVSTIILTVSPTVQGNATYQWSAGVTDNGSTGTITTMGTYTVTVTDDDNGCTSTESITINDDFLAPPLTLSSNEAEFNCNISTITLTASPTVQGNATYQWSTGVTDNGSTGTIVAMGTYTVTVTDDDNGCTSTESITIGEDFLAPSVTLASDEPEFNCNISTITLTASPTVQGNATYQWSTGVTDNGVTGTIVAMGTYTVTITDDDNGCTSMNSITIGEDFLAPTAVIIPSGTQLYCSVNSIDLDASSSTSQGALTYAWSSDVIGGGALVSVNMAGTYSVTITDINGCTNETSVVITALDPVMITELTTSNATCNGSDDGTISILASGGDNTFTYAWNGDAIGSNATAVALSPNTYTVTVTDGLGCTATYSYEVTEPLLIIPTLSSTAVDCAGDNNGTVTASATGGTIIGNYDFLWNTTPSQNTATATGLTAGTYTVTITDDNGCTVTDQIDVIEPLPLTLNISGTDVSCFDGDDGTATVVANGGNGSYTYLWSNVPPGQTNSINGLIAGTYSVTVTDINDCIEIATIVINQPTGMTLNAFETQIQSDCAFPDGAAEVTASNGTGTYTYLWDINAGSQVTAEATGLNAGSYNVTVTDGNGCTASTNVMVTGTFTIIPVGIVTPVDCNGSSTGAISVTTTGNGNEPFSYDWGTSIANPFTGLAAGNYPLTVTDVNNCSFVTSYDVAEPDPLVITIIDIDSTNCNGSSDGTIDIQVSGGTGVGTYIYTWNGAAAGQDETVTNVPAGNYTVDVEDGNGCMISEMMTVDEPSPIVVSLVGMPTPANCTACDGTAAINVVGGSGPYTYLWNNGNNSPMPTNLCSGINTVTVFDSNNCSTMFDVLIDNVTTLVVDTVMVEMTSCYNTCDGTAMVIASGGLPPYNYQWDAIAGGQTTAEISGLCAGSYQVTVSDFNGCVVVETAIITSPTRIYFELESLDATCYGDVDGAVIIDSVSGGTAPYSFSLDNENYISDTIFLYQTSGDYMVYVQDANECVDSGDVFVYQPPELLVDVDPLDALINLGESITIVAQPNQANTSITWTPSDYLSCVDCNTPISSPLETTLYTAVVIDTINKCTVEEDVLIRVNKDRDVYVPNAFTPNGDGFNDFVSVYTDNISVERITAFRIFDRWGEMVFEMENFQPNIPELGWNGYLNGKRMNDAVFVHYVKVLFIDGTEAIYTGDVTLMR